VEVHGRTFEGIPTIRVNARDDELVSINRCKTFTVCQGTKESLKITNENLGDLMGSQMTYLNIVLDVLENLIRTQINRV
jgi:hypothetical protein